MAELKVMTVNIGRRPGTKERAADVQRNVISFSLNEESPDLALFQEFQWGLRSDGFTILHKEGHIGENYIYIHSVNSKEVGILFDKNKVSIQRTEHAAIPIPPGNSFDPNSRMCVCTVQSKTSPQKFICIAWHGPAYRSGISDDNKKTYLKQIMEFVNGLHEFHQLPVLIAGDFNLTSATIKTEVTSPFCLHTTGNNMIDFFVASEEFNLSHTETIDITDLEVLDHSPVVASFTFKKRGGCSVN